MQKTSGVGPGPEQSRAEGVPHMGRRSQALRSCRFPVGRLLHCTKLELRRHARKTALDAA